MSGTTSKPRAFCLSTPDTGLCVLIGESMQEKRCSKCKDMKEEFYHDKSKRDGGSWCKACHREAAKKRYRKDPEKHRAAAKKQRDLNPEKHKAAHKRWLRENPGRIRNNHLQRRYGITLDEYNEMFAAQGGGCALCGRAFGEGKDRPHVDHDHSRCGRDSVRGIIHARCNFLLSDAGDSVEVLQGAIDYLKIFAIWSA